MPDWTELVIRVPVTQVALAGDIASMLVPYGIYIEDYSDLEEGARSVARIDLIDEALLQRDRSAALVHVYLSPQNGDLPAEAVAYLRERYAAAGIPSEIDIQACRSEDWENNWKAYFHPLPVGERLLIQPVWDEPADPQGRAVLLLEPGLAFGSGSHATTCLCMKALEQYVTPGCAALDIGCGSGILSIAALLLGADTATGVDIDPMAVQNARENGARNAMGEPRLRFLQGDLTEQITGQYDIVASNIVADAIVSLAARVPAHLKPGGVWISSGIIDTREDDVREALARTGFQLCDRTEADGWICIAARSLPC